MEHNNIPSERHTARITFDESSELLLVRGIAVVVVYSIERVEHPYYPLSVRVVAYNPLSQIIYLEGEGRCDDSLCSCNSVSVLKESIRAAMPKAIQETYSRIDGLIDTEGTQ